MKPMLAPLLTTSLAFLAATPGVYAEGHWLLGLGLYAERSAYVGQNNSPAPFPYLAWENEHWHVGLDGLSYQIWDSDRSGLRILAEPQFGLSDPGQNDIDQRLERDATVDLGFEWRLKAGRWFVEASTRVELTQEHHGYRSGIAIGLEAELGSALLELSAQSRWRDRKLSAYLYGVSSIEASARMPAFAPGATWRHGLEASIALPFSKRSLMLFQLGITHLDSTAGSSPRIKARTEPSILLGWLWRF